MSNHRFLIIGLMLIVTSICPSVPVAQESNSLQGQKIPFDPAVRIGTLENGLQYFIKKNIKPENRAELRLAISAGSMQEDEDQLGIAHFVEHMAFNGSEHFSKNELVDYLESVGTRFGADLNAYTSFDETVYMLQVRTDDADHLSKGLLVLEDWAGGLDFDAEEIDKERGVVVSEWRTRLSAEQRMQQQYFPIMFHGSRYAERLPIGKPEIIENAEYDVVRRFYNDWYRPNQMCVIVVGDIDVDKMEKEIVTRFSDLVNPSDARPMEEYGVPEHEGTLVSVCSDPEASFTNVRIMYKHEKQKITDLQGYRASLVRRLYNRMINARLYELNSSADPPFVFASSGYRGSIGDLDTYTSSAMVHEGGTLRAFEVLLTENKRVLDHGFVQTELDREVQEMILAIERRAKEKDKTDSRQAASRLVAHFLNDSALPDADQTVALYHQFLPGVSLTEVNALAEQWMTDENRVIILTGPEKEDAPLPTKTELLNLVKRVSESQVSPYVDDIVDAPLFEAELTGAKIIERTADEALGINSFVLSNGIKVIHKQTDFKNDQILLAAFSMGGHSLYDDDVYKSAVAVVSIMRESGLSQFTPPQLDKKLSGKRVSLFPMIAERYEGFSGSSSVDDFEVLFQLLYLYVKQPRFHADGYQAYIKKQKTIYSNLLTNPNNYFGDQVTRIRYNNHPRRGFPNVEDLDKISLETVTEVYSDRFADLSDFTFVFTGAFTPEVLEDLCAKYLGSLPTTQREETWKDVGVKSPDHPVDTVFYRGTAPKSNVRVIYHGDFDWNDGNRFVFQAMIAYLRIQLRESLREDLGGVYGVSLSGNASKDPTPQYAINMSFNADPPRTQELIRAANEVIKRAASETASEEDLQKVKEIQRQSRVKALKQNRFWHSGMIGKVLYDDDLSRLTLEYLESKLDALTAEDIQAAVSRYFDDTHKIQAILYPENYEQQ